AGQAAGLDVLRLLPDTTAIALSYGIYKTDLSEDAAQHAVFVDVGHAATQVCVCALKRGQVQILGTAWDRNLGGRDLDAAIFEHFAKQVQTKHGLDVRSHARASLRLRMACERVKKVLTTNPEAPWSVESLMDDTDVSGSLKRDEFESLAASVLERLMAPVQEAMRQAELTPQDVQVVELLGSSSRVPSVVRQLGEFFGREPGRTLNAKETVARGCALQSAMLSPSFRVRELAVLDAFPHAIRFSWDKDGERVVSDVFERGAAVPSAKMLTFYRSEPFEIECAYGPSQDPAISDKHIATFAVGPFEVPAGAAAAKLKIKVMLNLNGRLVLDSVQSVVEEEVPEEEAKPAEAQADPVAMDQDAKEDKDAKED
ncbi:heat shock protein 70 Hsp70, partial [Helicosporidium sp. ATCC 50920]